MKIAQTFIFGTSRTIYRWISTAFVVIVIAVGNACFADTGQVPIGISDILQHVEQATVPVHSYTATVHQTVTRTKTLASKATLANQPSLIEEADYAVLCTTSGVVHVSRGLSLKELPQNTTSAETL